MEGLCAAKSETVLSITLFHTLGIGKNQSIRPFNVRVITLSGVLRTSEVQVNKNTFATVKVNCEAAHITCTIAPQPENASLSTAFNNVCDIVSKRSSGSYTQSIKTVL